MAQPLRKAELFAALADQTRLRILNLLRDGEVCVCFVVEVLKSPQPKVSRHLAYLRRSGLVTARRDGKWMHYRVRRFDDPAAEEMFTAVLRWLAQDPVMQRDRAELSRMCCSPRPPLPVRHAPRPQFENKQRAAR